jgi:hypothetical protein
MDYAERKKRSRRNGCSRNRTRRLRSIGGAYTAAYTFTGHPVAPGAPYANTVQTITDCGNQPREIVKPGPGGLPGMAGGHRRRRSTRRNNTAPLSLNVQGVYNNQPGVPLNNRIPIANNEVIAPLNAKMVGGRWGFEQPEVVGSAGIALSARDHVPCEATRHNPLNQAGGVGGPDSMFYQAPTAGYTNVPSDRLGGASGTLYDGRTPYLVQVPYEARTLNPACQTVGGGRRRNRKASRKSRKASRKNRRRSSRRNRRN